MVDGQAPLHRRLYYSPGGRYLSIILTLESILARLRNEAIRYLKGAVSHEATYSDGEIYISIRYFQDRKNDVSLRAWKVKLTDCKAKALGHLLSRPELCEALDNIMTFPALRSGLRLGNIDT